MPEDNALFYHSYPSKWICCVAVNLLMAFHYDCPNVGVKSPNFISSLRKNLICLIVLIIKKIRTSSFSNSIYFQLTVIECLVFGGDGEKVCMSGSNLEL